MLQKQCKPNAEELALMLRRSLLSPVSQAKVNIIFHSAIILMDIFIKKVNICSLLLV